MFKVYTLNKLDKTFPDIEQATSYVNSILSPIEEQSIRVTVVLESGSEKTIFKSKDFSVGDDLFFVKNIEYSKRCTVCNGNGDVYNEFQQPFKCAGCNGSGNTIEESYRVLVIGPCVLVGFLEKNNKVILESTDKTVCEEDASSSNYYRYNESIYRYEKIRKFSVPLIKCFSDQETAINYAREFNTWKEAERWSIQRFLGG